jgi:hypothetical protein
VGNLSQTLFLSLSLLSSLFRFHRQENKKKKRRRKEKDKERRKYKENDI